MPRIINAATKSVYTDPSGYRWVYYQDNETSSIFYVMPTPKIASEGGQPQFHLTEYVDAEDKFVTGLCQITTSLAPPPFEVQSAIKAALEAKGVSNPVYQAMPFQDLGAGVERNRAYLNYASASGTVSRTVSTIPSLSGSENTIFDITDMSQMEVQFFKDYFGGDDAAGAVQVTYQLTVIAHLQGVTAQVQFDAQAAFEYQRTYKWVS